MSTDISLLADAMKFLQAGLGVGVAVGVGAGWLLHDLFNSLLSVLDRRRLGIDPRDVL